MWIAFEQMTTLVFQFRQLTLKLSCVRHGEIRVKCTTNTPQRSKFTRDDQCYGCWLLLVAAAALLAMVAVAKHQHAADPSVSANNERDTQ